MHQVIFRDYDSSSDVFTLPLATQVTYVPRIGETIRLSASGRPEHTPIKYVVKDVLYNYSWITNTRVTLTEVVIYVCQELANGLRVLQDRASSGEAA